MNDQPVLPVSPVLGRLLFSCLTLAIVICLCVSAISIGAVTLFFY